MANRSALLAFPIAFTLAFPALAQDQTPPAEKGARILILGLDVLLQSIPQYELPVVLENGDILIRRIQKPQPTTETSREE
ncbi:hypothetical protein ACFL12_00840 [Pseudomonadota bacterium]